jgi:hypothetical protein
MIMLKREPVREKSRLLMELYMPFYVVFSEYQVPRENVQSLRSLHGTNRGSENIFDLP